MPGRAVARTAPPLAILPTRRRQRPPGGLHRHIEFDKIRPDDRSDLSAHGTERTLCVEAPMLPMRRSVTCVALLAVRIRMLRDVARMSPSSTRSRTKAATPRTPRRNLSPPRSWRTSGTCTLIQEAQSKQIQVWEPAPQSAPSTRQGRSEPIRHQKLDPETANIKRLEEKVRILQAQRDALYSQDTGPKKSLAERQQEGRDPLQSWPDRRDWDRQADAARYERYGAAATAGGDPATARAESTDAQSSNRSTLLMSSPRGPEVDAAGPSLLAPFST